MAVVIEKIGVLNAAKRLFQKEIDRIVKEEAEKAGKRVQERVAEAAVEISFDLSERFDAEHYKVDVNLNINFPEPTLEKRSDG